MSRWRVQVGVHEDFLFREIGDRGGVAASLEASAGLVTAQKQTEQAVRLWGAAEALREAMGASLRPTDHAEHERSIAAIRAALGEEAFAAASAEGRALTLEDAIRYALG